MSFVYPDQVIAKLVNFSGPVTGTPTIQLYINGVATGSPINGTGSGSAWVFTITLPAMDKGDYAVVLASGLVSGITQTIEVIAGTVVEVLSDLSSPDGTGWPLTWSNMSGPGVHENLTLYDVVNSLTLRSTADDSSQHNARMVKAAQSAIRTLHAKHNWNYYKRQTRFTTSEAVDMEIEYDHTGGSNERLVTITSAHTWPTDAEYGEIYVSDQAFRIYRRLTDTTATLEPDHSLTEDYEGAATWKRRAYSFGREILKVEYCHNVTANRQITALPSTEFNAISFSPIVSGYTRHFSWQNHGGKFGGSEFILHPAPISKEIIEVSAATLPITPTLLSVTGTDLAGTIGAYTITSAMASFTKRLVGCVIRISGNAAAPIDLNVDNWDFQSFIVSVGNGTTLTLSDPLPQTFSSNGYNISSPLDIEASIMLEAFEDEAYYQYTKNHDHKSAKTSADMARKSLIEAMTRDQRIGTNSLDAGTPFWQWNKTDFNQVLSDD